MKVYAGAPAAARCYLEAGRGRADDYYLAEGTGLARRYTATAERVAEPLKSETSRTPLPTPSELALALSAAVAQWGGDFLVTDGAGRQSSTWAIERAVRGARPTVAGLPEAFRFHDLRHY